MATFGTPAGSQQEQLAWYRDRAGSAVYLYQSCVLLQLKRAISHPHCCGLAPCRSARFTFTLHSTWLVTPLGCIWCPWGTMTVVLLGFFSVQSTWNAEKAVLHHTRIRVWCQRQAHRNRSGWGRRRPKYCWDRAEAQPDLARFASVLPRADLEHSPACSASVFSWRELLQKEAQELNYHKWAECGVRPNWHYGDTVLCLHC